MLCECNLKAGTTFDKTVWLDYCCSNRSADTQLGRKKELRLPPNGVNPFPLTNDPRKEINDLIQAVIL